VPPLIRALAEKEDKNMPDIILKNVTKMYGKNAAVDHLNLVIPDHSFITLLGPSGCGKNNYTADDCRTRNTYQRGNQH
jgi:ABC-type phosphate transport system ATPase subunit